MEKISWVDKISNKEVLQRVNEIKTRMCANARRNGRLPNIGGALCSTPQSLADANH